MLRQWDKPSNLKHKHNLKATVGLLAPNGQLFECAYGDHSKLGRELIGENEWYSDYGFIHVDDSIDKPDFEPTQAQLNTIFVWCVEHNRSFPYWTGLTKAEAAA